MASWCESVPSTSKASPAWGVHELNSSTERNVLKGCAYAAIRRAEERIIRAGIYFADRVMRQSLGEVSDELRIALLVAVGDLNWYGGMTFVERSLLPNIEAFLGTLLPGTGGRS